MKSECTSSVSNWTIFESGLHNLHYWNRYFWIDPWCRRKSLSSALPKAKTKSLNVNLSLPRNNGLSRLQSTRRDQRHSHPSETGRPSEVSESRSKGSTDNHDLLHDHIRTVTPIDSFLLHYIQVDRSVLILLMPFRSCFTALTPITLQKKGFKTIKGTFIHQ